MKRQMQRLPIQLAEDQKIKLSTGGQNILIKKILKDLCSLFTPGGYLIYIGDAHSQCAYYDAGKLATLGVTIEEHGKMPDVAIHHVKKNWLVLIEAVPVMGRSIQSDGRN